jgi:protein SCO1/2
MRALAVVVVLATRVASAGELAIGLDEHLGAKVPRELHFVDTTGASVTLARYFDGSRPIVLLLAYARCRMLCSVVLHGMSDAIRKAELVPGRDYLPIIVSLDPRETPAEAKIRQATLLADIDHRGEWPYLVGDEHSIHALADALGFRYAWDPRTEQFAHPAVAFVIAPDGRIAEYLRGVAFDSLDAAVHSAKLGMTTDSTARDLLRCFHFEPTARKYGSKIQLAFRLGATVIFTTILAALVALVVWERRRMR